jgi:hypothetical protein
VHELDGHRALDDVVGHLGPAGQGGGHGHDRPEALPTGHDEVAGQLGQVVVLGAHGRP